MNRNLILFISFVILCALCIAQCNHINDLQRDIKLQNINLNALKDTVRIETTKYGDSLFLKNVFIANKNELKKYSESLASEIKKLKGDILYLQTINNQIKSDTIYLTNNVTTYPNGITRLTWKYDTMYDKFNSHQLSGYSEFQSDSNGVITDRGTVITKDNINLKLVTALVKYKKVYQIEVRSDYPGLTITDMEGAVLDKKMVGRLKSTVVIGPTIGVGLGYNPINQNIQPTINLGIGITYNINKLLHRK